MFKPVLPEQSITVVSHLDPAIDQEQSTIDEYAEIALKNPQAWRDHFKFKEGAEPTEFEIGVIPSAKLIQIESECKVGEDDADENRLRWLCFIHGVRELRNFSTDIPKVTINGVEYVDPEYLAKTFTRNLRRIATGIGAHIYFWNMLNDDESKN